MTQNAPNGPLAGLRVIDLSTVVMGPYAAQILGDLGADVIKIESPTDTVRNGSYSRSPGMTALSLNVNRNKRSIALDLKSDEGHAQALALLATADALITNMREPALQRLGLDYPSIAEANPHLVYTHGIGFRADSPQAGNAAYDETVQASSGLVDLANRVTGKPIYLPSIFGDKVTSLTIVYSTMAALLHSQRTGEGQYVEIPMTDTLLAFSLVEHLAGHTFEPPLGDTGFPLSMSRGHRAVPTKDGLACIVGYTPANFRDLFTAAGRSDLAEDPRVCGDKLDPANTEDLQELLMQATPALTTDEWERVCAKASIPMARVLDLDTAHHDPYVVDGHLMDVVEHPTEGSIRTIGIPMRFSATPASIRRQAPRPGADSDDILAELGEKKLSR